MKPLMSDRARCRACGMKIALTQSEADFLANQPGSPLVSYFCPVNNGWHVAREDDERLREGVLDYD